MEETVPFTVEHAPDVIQVLWWVTGVLAATVIALLLRSINRELGVINDTISSFKQEVSDDILVVRQEQQRMWSQISDTKKNVISLDRRVAVMKNQCDIWHGVERRTYPAKPPADYDEEDS